MIANLLIVAFVLAMIYWWALQGFFSAFIHMIIVIIAGSLALALWEPLVYTFGLKMQPMYAWGLWLLGPFALILIALRVLSDKLVPGNVQFQNLFSNILGGLCGLVSGVLTAGLAVIGLGHLPLPASMAGYQPLLIAGGGQVDESGTGLWIPVDTIADNTFARLSMSGFYPSLAGDRPLAVYSPNLRRQANLFRMRYDEHASVVAVPDSVRLSAAYEQPLPVKELDAAVGLKLGPHAQSANHKLVLVDTSWSLAPGTYDQDSAVRVPPTQIRLVTREAGIGGGTLGFHAPVAFVHQQGDERVFFPFDAANVSAFGNRQTEVFGWAFTVPADHEPLYLLARRLRLPVGELNRDAEALVAAMGRPAAEEPSEDEAADADAAGPSEVEGREGVRTGHVADQIELSNKLPRETSKNFAPDLQTVETGILAGSAVVSGRPSGRTTRIDSIHIPSHQGGVRLRLTQDRAQSLLGQFRAQAASLGGVWLTDARGERWFPIGYVWAKAGQEQEIHVDRIAGIRSAQQLPVPQMNRGDELYLYFAIPNGARIVEYSVGDNMTQPIDPPLVVE